MSQAHAEEAVEPIPFDSVRFAVHSDDHLPPHVHGHYAETEVIFEVRDGGIWLASRADKIRPANAKRGDVKKILRRVATVHGRQLLELWESVHGRV